MNISFQVQQADKMPSTFGPEASDHHFQPKRQPSSRLVVQSDLSLFEQIESHRSDNIIANQTQQLFSPSHGREELLSSPMQRMHQSEFLKVMLKQSLLHKFKNQLIENAYILPKHLQYYRTQRIYDFLNFAHEETQKSWLQQLFEKLWFQVLPPSNYYLRVWDMAAILFYIITLWYCTFFLSFTSAQSQFPREITLSILIFVIFDFLINCNKGIIVQGEVIVDRLQLMQQYLSTQFFGDISCIIFWTLSYFNIIEDISIGFELITLFQVIILIRKIYQKYRLHIESFCLKGFMNAALDLLVLIISTFLFAHFLACTWHYIGIKSAYLGKSWLIKYELAYESIWVRYNYSFYWATMTMVTVGYGDITAQNDYEVLCSSIMMFISSCVFAYTMNSIGMILKNLYDQQLQYNRSLALINDYMIHNAVDYSVQSRVRNYLKYYMKKDNTNNEEELSKVVNNLPSALKSALNNDIQMRAVSKIKLLTQFFSNSTLQLLSQNLELYKFTPGEKIYNQNDYNETNLLFVVEGQVSLIEERSNRLIQRIEAGQTFGEYQFFTGQGSKTAAYSDTFSQIYKVQIKQFLQIVKQNQRDFEIFHTIKEELLYNNNYSCLNISCTICKKQNHQTIDCPCISFRPNLEFLIKQEYFQIHTVSTPYLRTNYRQQNAMQIQKMVESTITDYQEQNSELCHSPTQSQNSFQQETHLQKGSRSKTSHSQLSIEQKEATNNIKLSSRLKKVSIAPQEKVFDSEIQIESLLEGDQHKIKGKKYQDTTITQESCQLDEYKLNLQFHYHQIDKLFHFDNYMVQHNINNVIRLLEKSQAKKLDSLFLRIAQKYTLYDRVRIRAVKLRMHFQKPQSRRKNKRNGFRTSAEQL